MQWIPETTGWDSRNTFLQLGKKNYMQEGQKCTVFRKRVSASDFAAVPWWHEMTVTFNPNACIFRGDNTKLHKDMPNMRKTVTSNGAVIELIIKPENKQAGWPLSSVWFSIDGMRFGLWKGSIQATKCFSNSAVKAGSQFTGKSYSLRQTREKAISSTNSMISVWLLIKGETKLNAVWE